MSRSNFVKLSALALAAILVVLGSAGSVSVHANPLQATDTAVATTAATAVVTDTSNPVATMAATAAAPAAATIAATMAATVSCPPVATVNATMAATMSGTMAGTTAPTLAATEAAFTPGFLGVAVSTSIDNCGSTVEEVVAGQAADKAGIKVNDEIIGADGQALMTSDALRNYVIAHQAGDTLNLSVLRGTTTSIIAVTLGTRPVTPVATVAATADTSVAATPVATVAATTDTSAAATPVATLAATTSN